MRILITGGFGFVGCNLVEALNDLGHTDILVLDNEALGKRAHLKGLSADVMIGDIRDPVVVDRAVAQTDAVVHLAAETRVLESLADPVKSFQVNVDATLLILEAMRRHNKRRIAFASTGGAIIGDAEPPLHENMVARPISPYGASKLAVEGYLNAYGASYDLLPVSFRFSNVYGPRSFHKGSAVATFFKAYLARRPIEIFGDGTQTRDFIYVGDLSRVIIDSLANEKAGVFQLGAGTETTLNDLIATMSEVIEDDLFRYVEYKPMRKGEVYRVGCDVSLARRELGYDPGTSLKDGLASTWEWFRKLESGRAPNARAARFAAFA